MALYSYGSQRTNTVAAKKLLERARPQIAIDLFFDHKKIKPNTANNITFRRADNATVDVTAAQTTEGTAPVAKAITYTDYAATLVEYGLLYQVSSRQRELGEDDTIKDSADILADEMVLIRETVAWNVAIGGANVIYDTSAHSSRGTVDDFLTLGRQQVAVRTLQANRGIRFTRIDNGGLRENTTPVEACYIALCHTDLQPSIRALPGFTPVAEYGGSKPTCEYEFGAVENVRYITTPHFSPVVDSGGAATTNDAIFTTANTACDVYPIVYLAKNAAGRVSLQGKGKGGFGNMQVHINSERDKADPLNQWTDVSARWYDVCLVLNDDWMVRLEVAAPANP